MRFYSIKSITEKENGHKVTAYNEPDYFSGDTYIVTLINISIYCSHSAWQ